MSGRGRSCIKGDLYHVNLGIMTVLRAYKMHQLDNNFDFAVAMEVTAAGKFDDILYNCSSPRLGTCSFCIQVKYKQNTGSKIEEDGLCSAWDSNATFSIPRYFVSFLEIDQKLPNDARYVLCNNIELHRKLQTYFKVITPQQVLYSHFCTGIGATGYQFDWNKPFPTLIAAFKDSCLDKLGKEFAQTVFNDKVIAFNDALFNIHANLIYDFIEPLEHESSDTVCLYKLKEAFFNDKTKPIEKFRTAFEKEWTILCKKKPQTGNNKRANELKLKIDRSSFITARNTPDHDKFDEKVREFYSKFLLVCNSFNEEKLREESITLLSQFCNAEHGKIFDQLQGELLEAMKTKKHVPLDLKFWQNYFVRIDHTQQLYDLKRSSQAYLESVHEKHPHIEINPECIKMSKLFEFLKGDSGCGIYEFKSTLDLTVSSRILGQALSQLQHETIIVEGTSEGMNILEDLLPYLRDVKPPTIKVITILDKHGLGSVIVNKKLSEKHCQKIVVVQQWSRSSQNEEVFEQIQVKDLSDAALSQLYTPKELTMFGTATPLSSIVGETDDLSLMLNVLELCDQPKLMQNRNLNAQNYENIKQWYIQRHFVSYEQEGTKEEGSNLETLWFSDIKKFLTEHEEELHPPGLDDSDGGKVCIFLNDAGLGKTTYFTWLAWRLSILDPSLLVIKFIAMEYSTDFKRLLGRNVQNLEDTQIVRLLYCYNHLALFVPCISKRTITEKDVIRSEAERCAELLTLDSERKIVLEKTNKLSTEELIELRLFQEKFNSRKIVLILDGFDEIAPCYKDVVMNCFARFSTLDGVRSLYLSSRPYGFAEELRRTFVECRFYRLKPFLGKDVMRSLHKFLFYKLDDYEQYETNHRCDVLNNLYKILKDVLKDIKAVPLFLYIIQTILLPVIKQHVNKETHTISKHMLDSIKVDKLHLVEEVIKRKVHILMTAKIGLNKSATVAAEMVEQSLLRDVKERHMLMAMYVFFNENDLKNMLEQKHRDRADEIMKKVNEADEKTGIVIVVQNGVPQFLHRSFAEYYCACWLYENRERFERKSIFPPPTMWSRSFKQIREFFDRFVLRESEDCDLHMALVNRSYEQINEIMRNNPAACTARDKVGRLPLHLLDYTSIRTLERILSVTPLNLINEKDQLLGWNALDYAFVFEDWNFIAKFFKGVQSPFNLMQPNMDNLFQQVCSNDLEALLVKGNKYVNILEQYLNRTDLAKLSERVAKYLVEKKQIDVHSPLAALNSLSVLERVVPMDNLLMFRQLVTESGSQSLTNDRAIRLLQLSLKEKALKISRYLIEQHPCLEPMTTGNPDLFYRAEKAIENNHMELFKTIFSQFCTDQRIECVEEEDFINEFVINKDNTLKIDIPFKNHCCQKSFHVNVDFKITGLLGLVIHHGNAQMVNYMLRKTEMVLTVELIIVILQQFQTHNSGNENHENCMSAYQCLFNKFSDVEKAGLIKRLINRQLVCVYMLPSLIPIGFVPKELNIKTARMWFELLLCNNRGYSSANILVYLQHRLIVDCFNIDRVTCESIFDLAITKENFITTQALIEYKFGPYETDLAQTEKENVVVELLQRLSHKIGKEKILSFLRSALEKSSPQGEMENETWHSVYTSIVHCNRIV
ncbi:uncharacterized protein LOC128718461 [Anopheles marshallii]|uniref:uncharacterized protein LOC128718461 n=1 Tax=Anopheles marshallii TaxID=1521116 RepID=UPI00237A1FCE|nr:uncharacterized protein LOC128718461 [Anopheles marshallii]